MMRKGDKRRGRGGIACIILSLSRGESEKHFWKSGHPRKDRLGGQQRLLIAQQGKRRAGCHHMGNGGGSGSSYLSGKTGGDMIQEPFSVDIHRGRKATGGIF